jgi:SAM-dependent methyltransferase
MTDPRHAYIHGYEPRESERLQAQAWSVVELLHGDARYAAGDVVLEAGCGTGAQTITLAQNNPRTRIVSVDWSAKSLAEARARIDAAGITNVEFHHADLFALPFPRHSFDHLFVCFVLEHLRNPLGALVTLRDFLKPGGTIVVFEGDHGSAYFHPRSALADRAIACQVELQRGAGGDPMIGRELYPLLTRAGYLDVNVSPRMVYVDGSRPELIDAFTLRTFTAMIDGVREQAVMSGLMDADEFDRGIRDLEHTATDEGVFCYTFFKGTARL